MNIEVIGDTLRVSDLQELGADNSKDFRQEVQAALKDGPKHIEVDLSDTAYVDSCGIGALLALHKSVTNRKGAIRLLNPSPPVQQILELTRMDQLFEVSKT